MMLPGRNGEKQSTPQDTSPPHNGDATMALSKADMALVAELITASIQGALKGQTASPDPSETSHPLTPPTPDPHTFNLPLPPAAPPSDLLGVPVWASYSALPKIDQPSRPTSRVASNGDTEKYRQCLRDDVILFLQENLPPN